MRRIVAASPARSSKSSKSFPPTAKPPLATSHPTPLEVNARPDMGRLEHGDLLALSLADEIAIFTVFGCFPTPTPPCARPCSPALICAPLHSPAFPRSARFPVRFPTLCAHLFSMYLSCPLVPCLAMHPSFLSPLSLLYIPVFTTKRKGIDFSPRVSDLRELSAAHPSHSCECRTRARP